MPLSAKSFSERLGRSVKGLAVAAVLLALAGQSIAPPQAWAAPVRNVTYEQFEQLVREKTAEIPELKNLWVWQTKHNEPVYLGGGILRGLLRWLEESLRKSTFDQVRAKKTPTVQELLIQKDADLDLFHDRVGREWFQKNMKEYEGWDILTKDFREQSIQAGGPAIEKTRVRPDRVEDPAGGLRAFYEGKLKYVDAPEEVFSRFRGSRGTLNSNRKSALVLRALRFANDLPSLEIDRKTKGALRSAVESELKKIEPDNYWIQKSLRKFHASTGKDAKRTLEALRSAGLLGTLARQGYALGDPKAEKIVDRQYLLMQLPSQEVSRDDFNAFKKNSSISVETIVAAAEPLLEKAQDMERVIEILDFGVEDPSENYRNQFSALLKRHLERIAQLKPDLEQLRELRTRVNTIESHIELMKIGIARAESPRDFLQATRPEVNPPSDAYKTRIAAVYESSVARFLSLNPSRAEVGVFKSESGSIAANIALMKSLIAKAKTADDFFAAVRPGVAPPTEAYEKAIAEVVDGAAGVFAGLRPSALEMNRYKDAASSIEACLQLMKNAVKNARSAKELIEALSPGVENPTKKYLEEISTLAASVAGDFMRLNPSRAQVAELKKLTVTVNNCMAITREAGNAAKSASDFLAAVAPEVEEPSEGYKNAISEYIKSSAERFAGMRPTKAQQEQAKGLCTTIGAAISVIRENAKQASTPGQLEAALTPGVASPSDAYLEAIEKIRLEHGLLARESAPLGCVARISKILAGFKGREQ